MGQTQSHNHVYNKSNYNNIHIKIPSTKYECKSLPPKASTRVANSSTGLWIEIFVLDQHNYHILKSATFFSPADISWIIRPDGIIQQKYGSGHSVEDPEGQFHPWDEYKNNITVRKQKEDFFSTKFASANAVQCPKVEKIKSSNPNEASSSKADAAKSETQEKIDRVAPINDITESDVIAGELALGRETKKFHKAQRKVVTLKVGKQFTSRIRNAKLKKVSRNQTSVRRKRVISQNKFNITKKLVNHGTDYDSSSEKKNDKQISRIKNIPKTSTKTDTMKNLSFTTEIPKQFPEYRNDHSIQDFQNLLIQKSSKTTAIEQIKTIIEKLMASDMQMKTNQFFSFLLERGEFLDMSIIDKESPSEWVNAFLMGEVAGRAISNTQDKSNLSQRTLLQFQECLNSLKMFYQGHTTQFHNILVCLIDKEKKELLDVKKTLTALQFLHISPERAKYSMSAVKTRWIDQLKEEWLAEKLGFQDFPFHAMKEMEAFWKLHDQSELSDDLVCTARLLEKYGRPEIQTISKINTLLGYFVSDNISNDEILDIIDPLNTDRDLDHWINYLEGKILKKELEKYSQEQRYWLLNTVILSLRRTKRFSCQWLEHFIKNLSDFERLLGAAITIFSFGLTEGEDGKTIDHILSSNTLVDQSFEDRLYNFMCSKYLLQISKHSENTETQLMEELHSLNPPACKERILSTRGINLQSVVPAMTEQEIRDMAKQFKNAPSKNIGDLLSLVSQAVQVSFSYFPRRIQLLTVLLLLEEKQSTGCLAKVSTGEGKSTTVAMIAAIKALQGQNVDVVTSSPILAERDCQTFQKFYNLLDLTAMHISTSESQENLDAKDVSNSKEKTVEKCYTANIVYGDSSGFEGDILRDEYLRENKRGGRKFDVVIVDEVDSMFIDQGGHATKLVDPMPGMEHLNLIFATIWSTLNGLLAKVFQINDNFYMVSDESYGSPSNDFLNALLKVLPNSTKTKFNLSNVRDIQLSVHKFAQKMMDEELRSKDRMNEIVKLLKSLKQNQQLQDWLPNTFQTLMNRKAELVITLDSDIVTTCIEEKWNTEDSKNFNAILEMVFGLNIKVFDVDLEKKELVESHLFYNHEVHEDVNILRAEEDQGKNHEIMFYINRFSIDGNDYQATQEGQLHLLKKLKDRNKYLKERIGPMVTKMIADVNDDNMNDKAILKFNVPCHLRELYKRKLPLWIDGALQTKFHLEENRDYIVSKKPDNGQLEIVPVDFSNTGVVQNNTVWSDGIHQFLQIKHKLRISPESLTTNCLSNMGFFKRYGSRIYGLTGTLGSEEEVKLLKHLYPVNTINIPEFKRKTHVEMFPLLLSDEEKWLATIAESVKLETGRKRAILLICNTIKDAESIQEYILKNPTTDKSWIIMYTRNEQSTEKIKEHLKPKTIVIATNLAGRGMDLKLSEDVLAQGGLHVCVTFLPANLRVEQQAIGRASRQGEPGTSQIIAYTMEETSDYHLEDLNYLKLSRDAEQREIVKNIQERVSKLLKLEESLFEKYCALRNKIFDENGKTVRKKGENIKDISREMSAMGEQWSQKLDEFQTSVKKVKQIDNSYISKINKEFDRFFTTLETDFKNESVIKSPYYYLLKGIDEIADPERGKTLAIETFTKGINMDADFAEQLYYFRAYCHIMKNKDGNGDKEAALSDLLNSEKIIQNRVVPELLAMTELVEQSHFEAPEGTDLIKYSTVNDSPFKMQIINKVNFYQIQLKSIQDAKTQLQSEANVKAAIVQFGKLYEEHKEPEPVEELAELRSSGAVAFFKIEKMPLPWWTSPAITLIGFSQIVAGAFLSATGIGLTIGAALITEGIDDLITGLKAYQSGEFGWKKWAVTKGIGIVISIALAGVGKLLKSVSALIRLGVSKVVTPILNKITRSTAYGYLRSGLQFGKNKFFTKPLEILSVRKAEAKRVLAKLKDIFDRCRKSVEEWAKKIFRGRAPVATVTDAERLLRQNLISHNTKTMVKLGVKQVGQQVAAKGVMHLVDKLVYGPTCDWIEDVIREKVKSSLAANLNLQNEIIFALIKFKNYGEAETKLRSVAKTIFESVEFRNEIAGYVNDFTSGLSEKIMEILKTDNESTKLQQMLLNAIQNSVLIYNAINQSTSLVDTFTTEFRTKLREEIPNDPPKIPTFSINRHKQFAELEQSLVSEWAAKLSKIIKSQIESGIIKRVTRPLFKSTADRITGKSRLKEQLERNKIVQKTNRYISNHPKLIKKEDENISFSDSDRELFDNFNNNQRDLNKESGAEAYPAIFTLKGRYIERWVERFDGKIVKDQDFGKTFENKSKEPIRILYRPSKIGENGIQLPGHYDAIKRSRNGRGLQVVALSPSELNLNSNNNNCLDQAVLIAEGKPLTEDNLRTFRQDVSNYSQNHKQYYIDLLKSKWLKSLPEKGKKDILCVGGNKGKNKNARREPNYFLNVIEGQQFIKDKKHHNKTILNEVKQIEKTLNRWARNGRLKYILDNGMSSLTTPKERAYRPHTLTRHLDGLFSIDIHHHNGHEPVAQQAGKPGAVRLLVKPGVCKKTGEYKKFTFLGICDDHSTANVQEWSSIPEIDQPQFLCYKNTQGVEYGVRKVSTKYDKTNPSGKGIDYRGYRKKRI